MHAADPARSGRLGRILDFLRRRGAHGATSLEIADVCTTAAVATYVSELRHGGHDIRCFYEGPSGAGGRVYRYVLFRERPEASVAGVAVEPGASKPSARSLPGPLATGFPEAVRAFVQRDLF